MDEYPREIFQNVKPEHKAQPRAHTHMANFMNMCSEEGTIRSYRFTPVRAYGTIWDGIQWFDSAGDFHERRVNDFLERISGQVY